jgi:ATP-dependent exoDNAse (exonuclease V) alpha subunit
VTQEEALKILKRGQNVYLTGAAGSGKTYLLNTYIQYLKSKGKNVGITASTGIAATHMGGITIHSWAGIGIRNRASDKDIQEMAAVKRIAKRMQKTDTLIIDEISMLDAARLDLVERVARIARGTWQAFGGMQVVLCGDYFQLPPVWKSGEPVVAPAFNSVAWQNLNLKICYLYEQHRQSNDDLLKILNAIRSSQVDESVVKQLLDCRKNDLSSGSLNRVTKLYTHNQDVDGENERELARIRGGSNRYRMQMSGIMKIAEAVRDGCLAPENLILKKGAAVMFVKNNFEKGYVNGSLGTVTDFTEAGIPIVTMRSGKEILAEPATWIVEENGKVLAQNKQIPLRLAWAITVHKSQGMTLDAARMDLSKCFEKGMGYIALSRVRSLEGLCLLGFNVMALKVNEAVAVFDEELKKLSEEALRESASLPEPREEEPVATVHAEEIKTVHPNARKRWTEEEEARLVAGRQAGKSPSELAEMLGRKMGGIHSRLKKLGLREQ